MRTLLVQVKVELLHDSPHDHLELLAKTIAMFPLRKWCSMASACEAEFSAVQSIITTQLLAGTRYV
jgi:hypothetical protein